MSYTVRRGDTLSALARRFETTVRELVQANAIRQKNLIRTGQQLSIPGRRDEFDSDSTPTAPAQPTPPSDPAIAESAQQAFDIARSLLGRNAAELKRSSGAVGLAMHDWVPNKVNCANFVSGVLQAAGQISKDQHSDRVTGLMAKLDRDPSFRRVSLADAKPGDVVSMKTPRGKHVVLFAGWAADGRARFIGSNNVNPDGSQRISYARFKYPILAVHHYLGAS